MNDQVHNAGQPTMQGGPPVRNLSGETRTVGSTVRQQRDVRGRFNRPLAHGTAIMADGMGGVETMTGTFMAGVRNNAHLVHPDSQPGARQRPDTPDYSQGIDPARKSNAGLIPVQDVLNHVLGCPACATGGMYRG